MENRLPRRQFLTGSTLAAFGFFVPRTYGILRSALDATAVALSKDDRAIIAELAAYSPDVYLWNGPGGFIRRKTKNSAPTVRSVDFLVRVRDFKGLTAYLNSKRLAHLGAVYAGGSNLAFALGTTAYTVTNYRQDDFERAGGLTARHVGT